MRPNGHAFQDYGTGAYPYIRTNHDWFRDSFGPPSMSARTLHGMKVGIEHPRIGQQTIFRHLDPLATP
jgi:hypothetical protein